MLPKVLSERKAGAAKQVAGRLCLDYANLVGGWPGVDRARDDRLTEYADLLAWSCKAGLLSESATLRLWREAQERLPASAAVLIRARRLRDAIHAIAWNFERGLAQRQADLQTLADEARLARSRQRLELMDGRLNWRSAEERPALDAPLLDVALSAEEYFTNADLSRLHACPGDECGWHFEDGTRNRSRHWCDMGDCGNTAKVRRFRSRRRSGARRGSVDRG